ncbi:MAG: AI-2E family transporter [Syntrophomonadaceae bacterium]|nr:AI-2E family transporter [Syntrophomonadaceae bacterium]
MQFDTGRATRYLLFLALLAGIIYFLYLLREVLLVFGLGALLAYLLFRPVSYIAQKGIKRVWAILILYLLVLVAIALLLLLLLPGMIKELSELARLLPDYVQKFEQLASRLDHMQMPAELKTGLNDSINQGRTSIYNTLNNFIGGFYNFLGKLMALIFSPILAFYIMNDWEKIKESFLNLLSPRARRQCSTLAEQIDSVLIEFLKGHLMVAGFVGSMVGIAAVLLGVRFPLLLGLVAGIADLIPYFGAFLGAVPAILVALGSSLQLAMYMAVAVLLIQQVESNIITPRIMSSKLGIHPLLLVFALLSGGKLLGIWGMLFAVPILATLKVIVRWAYLKLVSVKQ